MSEQLVRLDKALADEGVGTRSEVKKLITKGLVTVNGAVVRDPATKVIRGQDAVAVSGAVTATRQHIYLLMNKPAGVVSATEDGRDTTVVELVPPLLQRRGLAPVGRLDKDTTGMMILSDDGDFSHRVLSPRSHVPKRYLATLDVPVTDAMKRGFDAGIQLKDEKKCMPASLVITGSHTALVTIHEGMYHQIKRMFGCYGAKVVSLRRVAIGGLAMDESLPEGSCRELTVAELALLQSNCSY